MTWRIGGEAMSHKNKVQVNLTKTFNKTKLTADGFDLTRIQASIIELLKQKEDSIFNFKLKRAI